ncbi:MAG TPA: YdcF family protein [Acidimicrobiales bacterium]|nr:YdcF family protein [Acidimicrobiales bacterium]
MIRLFRWGLRLFAIVGVVTFAYLMVTAAQVFLASRRDETRQVQAIVVFGAAQYDGRPSPVLEARLDHAASLYEDDIADLIAVTGGRQEGDRFTEATASANYLSRRGVPQESILREVTGENSWESLASTAAFLKDRDIYRVLLVSDPFHAARTEAMADELGLEAYSSPTRSSPIRGMNEVPHLAKETFAVAAGQLIGFRRLMRVDAVVERARVPPTER